MVVRSLLPQLPSIGRTATLTCEGLGVALIVPPMLALTARLNYLKEKASGRGGAVR